MRVRVRVRSLAQLGPRRPGALTAAALRLPPLEAALEAACVRSYSGDDIAIDRAITDSKPASMSKRKLVAL